MATEEEEGPLKIEDTNMDGYGGEEHRAKQKALADKQPEWFGAGEKEGVIVWRIEKFMVKKWDQKGTFYAGDSFIILHTYKETGGDELKHNVHFWLGENTSQDEAGAAAIKTVELDDKLGDLPVQYRQVQGHETKEFTDIFPNMNILEGGVDSGFNHVEPTEYETRLFHVWGKNNKVKAKQIPLNLANLNNQDVFVLDKGTELIKLHTPKSTVWERRGGLKKMEDIADGRSGKVGSKATIDWSTNPITDDHEKTFWAEFGLGKGDRPPVLPDTSEYQEKKKKEKEALKNHVNKMYHITNDNENGEVTTVEIGSGKLDYDMLAKENDDVLIIDVGCIIYVWIGATANRVEISHAMDNAQKFLKKNGRPFHTPIKRIISGAETPDFKEVFGVEHVSASHCTGEN